MPDKRYQVFISSTYKDLVVERQRVMQTVMQLDCIPAGMELFPAADEEQFQFIKRVIDDCDYYILILGGRYGSVATDGFSYTEKEYDYAVSKGIKVIAFIHSDPQQIVVGKSEADPSSKVRLEGFCEKVRTGRLVKTWSSPAELAGEVALSLSMTMKTYPATGWVRGGATGNPELLDQINKLRSEADGLKEQLRSTAEPASAISDLAQGADQQLIMGSTAVGATWQRWQTKCSWDELFYHVGPFLLYPQLDDAVNKKLGWAVAVTKAGQPSSLYNSIDDHSFDTIKVQFLALGYVFIRQTPTTDGKNGLFWSLTQVGLRKVVELRSVKNKSVTPKESARSQAVQAAALAMPAATLSAEEVSPISATSTSAGSSIAVPKTPR